MDKKIKIIIALVAAIVTVGCVGIGINSVKTDEGETNATASTSAETVTSAETTAMSTTAVPAKSLAEQILGKWMDSAGMSGYEFFSDGRVAITYANLEGFNIPFDGTADNGVYTLEGNRLTVKYSIYTATIDKKYEISIDGDTIYMKDLEDFETATYRRVTTSEAETTEATTVATTTQTTTASQSSEGDLIGSWTNTEKGVKYHFKTDGSVDIYLNNVVLPALGTEKISTTLTGAYSVSAGVLTLQYSLFGTLMSSDYSFEVSKNTLKLTDESGECVVYSRAGTDFSPVDESELLGTWRDGVDMSGYEFKEDGIVKITFVNLTIPVIDFPVNGTFTGSYEVESNEITLSYSIYGNTISNTYTFEINGNVLTMTNKKDGNVSTYIKK